MSWMDSWSRPKKNAATPPPLYLTSDQVRYCHSCGRVIGSRKSQSAKTAATEVKFCSDRCKRHKLRPVDRRIEAAFAALLDGQDASQFAAVIPGEAAAASSNNDDKPTFDPFNEHHQKTEPQPEKPHDKYDYGKGKKKQASQQKVKGDPRILVSCSEVETLIYGSREDPEKTFGRKKNRARRGVADGDVWKSIDMVDSDSDTGTAETASADDEPIDTASTKVLNRGGGGVSLTEHADEDGEEEEEDPNADIVRLKGRIRPPQSESEVNGSIGGEKGWAEKIHETPEMLQKRRDGQRRAEEKEIVKCAARRAVVFGLESSRVVAGETKKGKRGKDDDGEGGEGKQEGRRMCEAVMHGAVVEPSYAKGDWSIRWREE